MFLEKKKTRKKNHRNHSIPIYVLGHWNIVDDFLLIVCNPCIVIKQLYHDLLEQLQHQIFVMPRFPVVCCQLKHQANWWVQVVVRLCTWNQSSHLSKAHEFSSCRTVHLNGFIKLQVNIICLMQMMWDYFKSNWDELQYWI